MGKYTFSHIFEHISSRTKSRLSPYNAHESARISIVSIIVTDLAGLRLPFLRIILKTWINL